MGLRSLTNKDRMEGENLDKALAARLPGIIS